MFDDIQPYQNQGLMSACLRRPTGGSRGLEVLLHSNQSTRHRLPSVTRKLMGRPLKSFTLDVLGEDGVRCDKQLSCQTLAPAAL